MAVGAERDIVVDVTIKSDTRGAKAAAGALGDVDKSADRAGRSMRGMASDSALLDAEILKTSRHIEELERTMVRTGDRSMQRAVAAERRWLASLRAVPGEDSTSLLPARSRQRSSRIFGVPTPVVGIAAGALAVSAPAIGALIAGAVSGAIGTGGVLGGVLMAARDPKVKSAAAALGDSLMDEFFRGGDAFVKPVLQSMTIIDQAFKDMKLPEAFEKMAPHVTTIAQGIGDLGKNLMPGLNKAFDRMGPFANVAREGLGDVGTALGYFIDKITESKGAIAGLRGFFQVINGLIEFTADALTWLADRYYEMLLVGKTTTDWLMKIPALAPVFREANNYFTGMLMAAESGTGVFAEFGGEVEGLARSFEKVELNVGEARVGLTLFGHAIEAGIELARNSRIANIDLEQAFDDFTESVRENGRTLDIDTQAGRDNALALEAIAQGAREAYIKTAELTGGVVESTKQWEYARQKLYDTAIALGYTKDEAQKLVDKLLGIPPEIAVNVKVAITPYVTMAAGSIAAQIRSLFGFAEGGMVPGPKGAPQLAVVHGGERVLTPEQQYAMAMGGGGGGNSTIKIIVADTSGRTLREQLIDEARLRNVSQTTIAAAYP